MKSSPIVVDRARILSFRRLANGLDARRTRTKQSLRRAAWAGLQDSMPRAAVLSLHARIDGIDPFAWEDPAFVQVWGPRYSAYAVPATDVAFFTLGRLPDDEAGRDRAFGIAKRLHEVLADGPMDVRDAGKVLGRHPNMLRYATTTGTIAIRWDGARQPTVWTIEEPSIDPWAARSGLAKRFLHTFGPSTATAFGAWAGLKERSAEAAFDRMRRALTPVRTPIGDAWILNSDVDTLLDGAAEDAPARLLPSGDAYYLLQGAERRLLVPNSARRDRLWTSRVWPGAILANGAVVGTWRRSTNVVAAELWARVSRQVRDHIEAEVAQLPIQGAEGTMRLEFDD